MFYFLQYSFWHNYWVVGIQDSILVHTDYCHDSNKIIGGKGQNGEFYVLAASCRMSVGHIAAKLGILTYL